MSKDSRFFEMKRQGKPISLLTAYDYPTAKAAAEAGVDIILVGDSAGMNILRYANEREVTLADMVHHVRAVRCGAPETPILADLPYRTYDSPASAIKNARALVGAGADMVKFEGPSPQIAHALVTADIVVCGHLGRELQYHHEKQVRGRSAGDAVKLLDDAIALYNAGVSMLVLELVPEEVAEKITTTIRAPTIGIGAGRYTDGQGLAICDVLGFIKSNVRHNHYSQHLGQRTREAAAYYVRNVRLGAFPTEDNVFHLPPDELSVFIWRCFACYIQIHMN